MALYKSHCSFLPVFNSITLLEYGYAIDLEKDGPALPADDAHVFVLGSCRYKHWRQAKGLHLRFTSGETQLYLSSCSSRVDVWQDERVCEIEQSNDQESLRGGGGEYEELGTTVGGDEEWMWNVRGISNSQNGWIGSIISPRLGQDQVFRGWSESKTMPQDVRSAQRTTKMRRGHGRDAYRC